MSNLMEITVNKFMIKLFLNCKKEFKRVKYLIALLQ